MINDRLTLLRSDGRSAVMYGAMPLHVWGRRFFAELVAYLLEKRPPGLATPACFVVLRGPTAGRPLTEAGLRSLFRCHRDRSGVIRGTGWSPAAPETPPRPSR